MYPTTILADCGLADKKGCVQCGVDSLTSFSDYVLSAVVSKRIFLKGHKAVNKKAGFSFG